MSIETDPCTLLPPADATYKEVHAFYTAGAELFEQTVPAHADGLDLARVGRFMRSYNFAPAHIVVTTSEDYAASRPALRHYGGLAPEGSDLAWAIPGYRAGAVLRDKFPVRGNGSDTVAIESALVHELAHAGVRERHYDVYDYGEGIGPRQVEFRQGFRYIELEKLAEGGSMFKGLFLEEARASYYQQRYRERFNGAADSANPRHIITNLGRLAVPRSLVFTFDHTALSRAEMLPVEGVSDDEFLRKSNIPGVAIAALCTASPRLRRVMERGMNSFKPHRLQLFAQAVNSVDAGLYDKIKKENLGTVEEAADLSHELVNVAAQAFRR